MSLTLIGAIETIDKVFGAITSSKPKESLERLKTEEGRNILFSQGSMVKLMSKFIIEPRVIVSNKLKNTDQIDNSIKFQIDLFTMLYMRTFEILTKIYNLDSQTSFNLLSSSSDSLTKGYFGLEAFDAIQAAVNSGEPYFPGLEAKTDSRRSKETVNSNSALNATFIKDIEVEMYVKGNGDNYKVTIPVLIKAQIIYVDSFSIYNLLESNNDAKKLMNRWDEYRSGAISLKDLIFATDLIKESKKRKMDDANSLIKNSEARARSSMSKYVTDGAAGFNKYYQMIIISEEEEVKINASLRGKLTKDRVKEKFLEQTRSLTLTVMNEDWERATIFIKDLKGYSDLSYKQLAKGEKKNQMDDLYKLLLAGRNF